METKRQFTKVKNHPGIYFLEAWDEGKKKYVDSRYLQGNQSKAYRAMRRIRVNGTKVQQMKHFRTLEEAKQWRMQATQDTPVKRRVSYTIQNLIEEWRDWSKPPRFALSTWQVSEKDTAHFGGLVNVPVEELSAEDIDQWLKYVVDPRYPKKASRFSFLRELKALKTMLNWYREYKNPKFQPPLLKRHKRDCVFRDKPQNIDLALRADDLEKFLEVLRTSHSHPVYYRVAVFQALTGARIGEACGMPWKNVSFEYQSVEINQTCFWDYRTKEPSIRENTKTGERRSVILPPRLLVLLRQWKEEGSHSVYVFHKDGSLLKYNAIQSAYKRAFQTLGLPVRSTHVLRHTFAAIFSEQTEDIRGTQAALGHRDLRITQHYAKVSERTQRKVMHKFALGQLSKEEESPPSLQK